MTFNYFIQHPKISVAFHNTVLMNEQTLMQSLLILSLQVSFLLYNRRHFSCQEYMPLLLS